MIEFRDWITREMLRAEPDVLFVFGDNLARRGKGGQAAAMRGEPNAVGIPTKIRPSMDDNAFFSNEDFEKWKAASIEDWRKLFAHVRAGGKVVWPSAGIGTDRARLNEKAPEIAASIERNLQALQQLSKT
ncbi:hypothetical protein TH24_20540 [Thalassospira xiamenensis]|jgi:hypothetical protein|nr:hypothetical protein TH24_20540 [Thalassospira xiamenensis]